MGQKIKFSAGNILFETKSKVGINEIQSNCQDSYGPVIIRFLQCQPSSVKLGVTLNRAIRNFKVFIFFVIIAKIHYSRYSGPSLKKKVPSCFSSLAKTFLSIRISCKNFHVCVGLAFHEILSICRRITNLT